MSMKSKLNNKIVVPLDGSTLSEKVLPYALRLAHRTGAQLLLVRVVEPGNLLTHSPQYDLQMMQQAQDYLLQVKNTITDPDVTPDLPPEAVHIMAAVGDPAHLINQAAAEEEAGLIMMTTHGRSGFSRLVVGSVAAQVLHLTDRPVMLVRPQDEKYEQLLLETLSCVGEPGATCFDEAQARILVTLDGSDLSYNAVEPAVELAGRLNGSLYLFRAVYPVTPVVYGDLVGFSYQTEGIQQANQAEVNEAEDYLSEIQEILAGQGLMVSTMIRLGNPEDEIIDYAKHIQATALVMATHARSEAGNFFLGSVADRIMRKTHLPVLMIPVHRPVKVEQPDKVEAEAAPA